MLNKSFDKEMMRLDSSQFQIRMIIAHNHHVLAIIFNSQKLFSQL